MLQMTKREEEEEEKRIYKLRESKSLQVYR
jgi:hypothetical protein